MEKKGQNRASKKKRKPPEADSRTASPGKSCPKYGSVQVNHQKGEGGIDPKDAPETGVATFRKKEQGWEEAEKLKIRRDK